MTTRTISITGLAPGYTDLNVEVDDAPIPGRALRGISIDADADDVPRVVLDLAVHALERIGADALVVVPEETREALVALGWAPPPEHGSPAPDADVPLLVDIRARIADQCDTITALVDAPTGAQYAAGVMSIVGPELQRAAASERCRLCRGSGLGHSDLTGSVAIIACSRCGGTGAEPAPRTPRVDEVDPDAGLPF